MAVQLAQIEVEQPSTVTITTDIRTVPGLQLVRSTPGWWVFRTRTGSTQLALATAAELRPPVVVHHGH